MPYTENCNILMLGARGTGKTSLLVSMVHVFNQLKYKNPLRLTSSDSFSEKEMQKRWNEVTSIFWEKSQTSSWAEDFHSSDTSENQYFFDLQVTSDFLFYFKFIDMPGKYMLSDDGLEKARKEIGEANVIIITIDTPHLLSEDRRYNSIFNISDLLSGVLFGKSGPKLILLVPTKCEKYYYERQMMDVNNAVKKSFSGLINLLNGDNRYTIAILPVLILGDVVFSHFGEKGETYYSFRKDAPVYSPIFCEQPMIYALNYLIKRKL